MAVYYIGSYDIVNPDEFQKYPPVVMALLPKYGGEVLASDPAAFLLEGEARTMNAIIRFPSREATTRRPSGSGRTRRPTSAWCWWRNSEARMPLRWVGSVAANRKSRCCPS